MNHPIRVGVSGITASGKTTFANELAEELQYKNKKVIRTSIDHFHNPRVIRYRQGKDSAIGYYEDAHDYKSFKEKLLIPLGPTGNLHYKTSSFDLTKDEYVNPYTEVATHDMIFIIDGTFLFKEELYNLYDFKIYIDTDFDIARKRGAKREAQAFGSYKKAEEMFIKRYHAASKLYLEQHTPNLHADVVIQNNDIHNPEFLYPIAYTVDSQALSFIELKQHLHALEQQLLQPETRTSPSELDKLLAEDFFEFSSSGKVWYKKDSSHNGRLTLTIRKMNLFNFEIHPLSDDTVLTTYHIHDETRKQQTLRSSIWKHRNGSWQMFFHQGTLTKE